MGHLSLVANEKHNISRKRRPNAQSLPEVFSTVDAGEDLAFPTNIHMIFYLSFLQGLSTGITGKENHFNDTLTTSNNTETQG